MTLLLLCSMSIGTAHAIERVRLGYFINEPHISSNEQSGGPQGVLVEFLNKRIAPEMGVKFSFVKQPLVRVLASMENGSIDGAVLFAYTPERAKRFNYPGNSFFNMQSVLTVNQKNPLTRVTSAEDIRHMKIVYAIGAITTPFIQQGDIKMELTGGENPLLRNLMRLNLGRVDAAYWPDEASVIYTLDRQNLNGTLKSLQIPEKTIPLFTIFSQRSKVKNLAERYDRAFEKVGGSDLYQKMMSAYIFHTLSK